MNRKYRVYITIASLLIGALASFVATEGWAKLQPGEEIGETSIVAIQSFS